MIRLDPNVIAWRHIESDVVAVDVRNSEYFSLSSSAVILWPLLDRGTTHEELVDTLLAEYDVERDAAARDVRTLVQGLLERGVILPLAE